MRSMHSLTFKQSVRPNNLIEKMYCGSPRSISMNSVFLFGVAEHHT